jgi:hypothetical protein
MFRIFKKKRRFSLTFAALGATYPTFTFESNGFSSCTNFHTSIEVTIYGKVSKGIILQTVKKYADECNDDKEKEVLEFLIGHTDLIAWSEID